MAPFLKRKYWQENGLGLDAPAGAPVLEPLEDRLLLSGDLWISEWMGVNDTTLADADGDFPDWIELHNAGDTAADLTGWHLTDDATDLTQWTFPPVTLGAGGYLVVFASDKDRTDPAEELHTNFKIGSSDAALALVAPDGVTVKHQYDLIGVTSTADVSYGILGTDPTPYYLTEPTPGAANVRNTAEAVEYSVDGGTFTTPFTLTLSVASPDATIHYTLDGSTPTAASPVYTDPLTISATTQVRTIVSEPDTFDGPITSRTYIALAPDVQTFNSNLPLVVLDTYGSGIGQVNDVFASAVLIDAPDGGRASITDAANYAGRSLVHVRGSSSTNFPKKQYKFETVDETDEDLAAPLLGMPAESDWVLYAPYSDKTLMRNVLTYQWFGEMGWYSVRTRYVEVFLNTSGASTVSADDYVGVYVLIEKIKADDDRVDIERMGPDDDAEPEVTGGYILEGVNESKVDGVQGVDWFQHSNMYLNYIEPRSWKITDAQKTYIANYLNTARSAMGTSNYGQYVNAASFVDWDIIQQITNNNDSWVGSVFIHKDREGRLNMGPVWDFNIAFGNVNYGICQEPTGWSWSYQGWPWYSRLAGQADFMQLWVDHWQQFRRTIFDLDTMLADIDELQAHLAEAQARDQARWPTLGTYVWPNPDGYETRTTWQSEIDFLKTFLTERVAWMDAQYTAPPAFDVRPGVVPDTFDVSLAGPSSGTIYVTTDGTDPRLPGAGVSSSASVYTPGTYTTTPLINAGATWRYMDTGAEPAAAWTTTAYDDSPWSAGAAPLGYGTGEATTIGYGPDPADKYGAAYFRRTFTYDGGLDDAGLVLRLQCDDGAVVHLNGVEVLRVNMADGPVDVDTEAAGEAYDEGLTWREVIVPSAWLTVGTNVLAVEVHQATGDSDDLRFDAELAVRAVATPSPTPITVTETTQLVARVKYGSAWSGPVEALYVAETLPPLRITELNYNPYPPTAAELDAGFTNAQDFEFIELTNVGDAPVSLMGVGFADGVEFAFAPDDTISPGQRMLLAANRDAFVQRYGFLLPAETYDLSLSNGGETLALVDGAGRDIQRFTYDDAEPWPFYADGYGATLEIVDTAGDYNDPANWRASGYYGGSPLWPGAGILGDVVINEVLTHTDLPDVDAIELHNTTASPIDIGGWYLSDSADDYRKFRIPDGTTIPAGGYVVFDAYDFNATGLNSDPSDDDPKDFGLSGAKGDHVWLMASDVSGALSRFVDHVRFGASFNGVPFGRYPNATGDLTALQTVTLGAANNDDPVIGPVIVSEIMYHPTGTDEDTLEYLELHNVSDADVPLGWYDANGNGWQDVGENAPWQLGGAVEFTFPVGAVLPAGGRLLAVDFAMTDTQRLDAFMAAYGLSGLTPGADIVGPWSGKLNNRGESVELYAFDAPPNGETFNPKVRVDRVVYSDDPPWPGDADGGGLSLHRAGAVFGNDPAHWTAAAPSPGQGASSEPSADFNGDGAVDLDDFMILKQTFGTAGPLGDGNGDGAVDLDDFMLLKQQFGTAAAPAVEAEPADLLAASEPAPIETARPARTVRRRRARARRIEPVERPGLGAWALDDRGWIV
ncbi:MAG: CotH kinase family protein [Planctomycetota bacterium]